MDDLSADHCPSSLRTVQTPPSLSLPTSTSTSNDSSNSTFTIGSAANGKGILLKPVNKLSDWCWKHFHSYSNDANSIMGQNFENITVV